VNKQDKQRKVYTGAYRALNNKDSEFALSGEMFGNYSGFNDYF